jgi:hypothetical protein
VLRGHGAIVQEWLGKYSVDGKDGGWSSLSSRCDTLHDISTCVRLLVKLKHRSLVTVKPMPQVAMTGDGCLPWCFIDYTDGRIQCIVGFSLPIDNGGA